MNAFRSAVLLIVSLLICPVLATGQDHDPCGRDGLANAERRQCYEKAAAKLNTEVELTAKDWIDQFTRGATKPESESPVEAEEFRKAAAGMASSQQLWKRYREEHCQAVAHNWTTGSGAGTAYAACLFRLTRDRLKELQIAFN